MIYQAIQFTAGRSGTGYLEISEDGSVPVAVLDDQGQPIAETVIEYHVIKAADVTPMPWMRLGA